MATVKELELKVEKLEKLLAFANKNLTFVVPLAHEDSEYDFCTRCGKPEWNHSKDCQAVAWKTEVEQYLKTN